MIHRESCHLKIHVKVDVSQKKRLSDESTIDGSQRKRKNVIYNENEGIMINTLIYVIIAMKEVYSCFVRISVIT